MSEVPKPQSKETAQRRPASARLILGVLILSGVMLATQTFDIPSCLDLQASIASWGLAAPVILILIYIAATIAFVPSVILTLASGLAFGPWLGTLYALIGATVSALLAFIIARQIATSTIEGLISKRPWFNRFKNNIEANGFNYMLFVRLVPVFPFNGLNYACGLVPLRLKDFLIGSFVGLIPSIFTYAYLGATACQVMDSVARGRADFSTFPPNVQRNLLIAVALLAALSVLPIFVKKLRKRRA